MNWNSGHKIEGGGGYIIQRKLGKGGFANAYLARNHHNEAVVIKTIKTEILNNPKYDLHLDKLIEDFEREGKRLALFKHSNIVKVKDFFYEKNLPCLCMEYIKGQNLGEIVENDGNLAEKQALKYIQQVGEALSIIHRNNLLHRDVKPQNIMIRSASNEAVLIDFGIAREYISDSTQTHTQLLSHGFAPLEQYDRQSKRGAYSDVYSTAATLYYMLTAEVPPASFSRIVRDSLIRPQQLNPRIGDRVERAIMIGMVLRPEYRPKSIEQWLRLLDIEISPQAFYLEFATTSNVNNRNASVRSPSPNLREYSDSDLSSYPPPRSVSARFPEPDLIEEPFVEEPFIYEPPQPKTHKIIPWFKIGKIALFSFPIYLLVAWLLAFYNAPNWMWYLTFISDINLKLFVLEDDNPNREIAISTWLFWMITTAIAGMGTFYSIYRATVLPGGIFSQFIAGICGSLLFAGINLVFVYFLKESFANKTKSLRLKKYYVLSLLVAISWLSLVIGWGLWHGHL